MGDRTVPFDENEVCDECGVKGAFDFQGDCYCGICAARVIDEEEKRRLHDKELTDFACALSIQTVFDIVKNEKNGNIKN